MFKIVAHSSFGFKKEDLPTVWQRKAEEHLTFKQDDNGRLVDFCCRLGVNPNGNYRGGLPLLHMAVQNVHEGTRGNLFALLRARS